MSPKRILALSLSGLALAAAPGFAACKLGKFAELPVTMVSMHPMVGATINGSPARFIADSGAFYSMMSVGAVAQFNLKSYPAPWGLRVSGIGGEAGGLAAVKVKEFALANVDLTLHYVEFLVGGGEYGGDAIGLLGQNVLAIGDVEFDLANGVIRLLREEGCDKSMSPYWVQGTTMTYSLLPIDRTTPLAPAIAGTAFVNGTKIRAVFDSGAYLSVLSPRAAERAGVKITDPGVVDNGFIRGVGKQTTKSWIAPFSSFKIGDEEIRNTHLRIGEVGAEGTDMLIGADFFLSHRIFVSAKQHRLFFTYNGGPVFNLTASRGNAQSSPGTADEAGGAEPDSLDAAQLSRRGTAYAARRDFEHAIADLTRACELAPDQPDYFYERGLARLEYRQRPEALADFDQAIRLEPDHVPALVARATLRLGDRRNLEAAADLQAADRAAPKEADVRLQMGIAYAHADLLPDSLVQLDSWIDAHREDARLTEALGERCWVRALSGQDPSKALDDCNTALRHIDKSNAAVASLFASRGTIRLRLGDYAKSMADFDEVLKTRPADAWALYGRGIAKTHLGKVGEDDIKAAVAASPSVTDRFKKHGLGP